MELKKTLESSLYSKEIKSVSLKGNQAWIPIGRTDAEAKTPILWLPANSWLTGKDPEAGKDWEQRKRMRGWDGCIASPIQWTWTWQTPGDDEGQRSLVWCSPWGCTQLGDWTTTILFYLTLCHLSLQGSTSCPSSTPGVGREQICQESMFRLSAPHFFNSDCVTAEMCSLEALMLKLKLQYFGHLTRRVDSLEKTLMLEGIGGRRRRGRQRMRWLDGITNSMDMG